MNLEHYILASIAIVLTSLNLKTRNELNNISQNISTDKFERNLYEIAMQPKWYLNVTLFATFFGLIIWSYLAYSLFLIKSWWAILYILGFFFSVPIVMKLSPFPSRRSSVNLFYSTVTKRLANESKYTFFELQSLRIAKVTLEKIKNSEK